MNYNSEGSVSYVNGVVCNWLMCWLSTASPNEGLSVGPVVTSLKNGLRIPACSFENV